MSRYIGTIGLSTALGLLAAVTGCASQQTATVSFSYVVEKEKGLPPGMKTIAIMPAKVGETTDPKWQELSTTVLASLINESRSKFGAEVTVTERRDAKAVFDEGDMKAAGMATGKGGDTKLIGAEGLLLSNINVKVEKHVGKQRTLSGLDIAGFGGHRSGGGRVNAETEEVETVTRNMTVQTEFKLVDSANGRVWEHFSPKTYSATDRTKASPIFGSSKTEAELTPQDQIIGSLVERGAREFVSQLMPCRIDVETEVESSGNKNCVEGVKLLRAEAYREAISAFQAAMAENPDDHRAAYGAGVACEATGQFEAGLKYYNKACAGENNRTYADARDRMKTYGSRIRK
jgi:Tetratricopeptide repeat